MIVCFRALAPFAVVFFVVVFVKGDTLLAGGSVTRLLACLLVSGCVFILTPRVTNLTARARVFNSAVAAETLVSHCVLTCDHGPCFEHQRPYPEEK